MTYTDGLAMIPNISLDKIIKLAKEIVPEASKNTPWIGLEHGVKLLKNDEELAQYLAAYGSMHREKLTAALDTIQDPSVFLSRNITIIDWGCGQGLASICFYDYMHNLGIEPSVEKIILIEPSSVAINRANEHLKKYTSSASIDLVNKYIDDVGLIDLRISEDTIVLHFFSNILDIKSVNIEKLSSLIKNGIKAEQFFFCAGPNNTGASRIAEFAKSFDIAEDDLLGEQRGHLSVRGTISMMVFHIKADITEIIKVEYYRRRSTDLENNTALNRILADMPSTTSQSQKALQFYRAVVALERMKSASITDVFYYPYKLDTTKRIKFNIDIQDNEEFEKVFLINTDRTKTKWPKHLNVGLCILWDDQIYRLLEYVYPFDDLKDIDVTQQYISVDLSMFSVSMEVADRLELTDDIVDAINATLSDHKTQLSDLESILKDAIGHTVELYPQLSLSLTAEAPVLSQINSELKTLSGKAESPLLSSFLKGNIKNNTADKVSEDDIINVVDMDDSQRHAIATALNSRISVVTGPPGTGKTQMIVNLLANAMLKGKSVLVASKNNKAVDNIKDRFDRVDSFNYLLRFGSRDMIQTKLIPALSSISASIINMQKDDKTLAETISNYNRRCVSAADARTLLGELVRLTDHLPEIEESLSNLESKRSIIEADYKREREALRAANPEIDVIAFLGEYDWGKIAVGVQKTRNTLQAKNTGLSKLFFNFFSKNKYAAQILNEILSLPVEVQGWVQNDSGIMQVADVKNCDHLILLCDAELKYVNRISSYRKRVLSLQSKYTAALEENDTKLAAVRKELDDTNRRIRILADSQDQLLSIIKRAKEYISMISGKLLSSLIRSRLTAPKTSSAIARYKNYLPDNIPWRSQDLPTFVTDARNFIESFRLNSVTSLSVKNAYPMESELFDMVIIDEASQCDIASALPLLYRTKQVVVIGDPLQLKHITVITVAEERIIKEHLSLNENPLVRYADYSLWDYCNDLITSADEYNTHVTLDCHYRCHPQIIGYSNEFFYQRKLGTTLKVCTKEKNSDLRNKGIIWVDVVGRQLSETRNINLAEVEKAISIATDLARQCSSARIGIISPFKHQAEEINARIPVTFGDRIVSDTVHKFQGDERDVIIYTTVVTNNSPDTKIRWIDHSVPNLVNVAVTRAKTALYVVGNRQYIKGHSSHDLPLGYLVEYTEDKLPIVSVKKETVIIDTNVFVDCPDVLNYFESSTQVIVSAKVVDELDKLKVTLEDTKRRNVELALRNLNRQYTISGIRMECADLESLPLDFNRKNADNMILSVALKYRNQNPILITSDNGLQLKAKGLEIKTMSLQTFLNDTANQ